ncbi:immunity 70 family protein [Prosthecomicrobium hirschii]|uniref:immunity 70 family protein n=1 Tax=Prosthecodimorpha hirschii TaxID=665126 RepID=UPI00221F5072|nr:immunity 70 family protein [Prosthecomicrobium hirschii]MCW1843898.1 immunity 70 family protein [Prosthecomicrobium hirschii]
MGLYLTVFDGDEEIDGIGVGRYADFEHFRDSVAGALEGGVKGSRFPILMLHSDCDGEWPVAALADLKRELIEIRDELREFPPDPAFDSWRLQFLATNGITPKTLMDSFFDIDGNLLIDRILELIAIGTDRRLPILFQ